MVRMLIDSLEEEQGKDYEKEWNIEIEKRAQDIIDGNEKGKDAKEVFKKAYNRLK